MKIASPAGRRHRSRRSSTEAVPRAQRPRRASSRLETGPGRRRRLRGRTATRCPTATLKLAKEADAILFGAVGDWKYDSLERALRPEQAILGLRKHLAAVRQLPPGDLLSEQLAGRLCR